MHLDEQQRVMTKGCSLGVTSRIELLPVAVLHAVVICKLH